MICQANKMNSFVLSRRELRFDQPFEEAHIAQGADPNVANIFGYTPLHLAASAGNVLGIWEKYFMRNIFALSRKEVFKVTSLIELDRGLLSSANMRIAMQSQVSTCW